MGWVYRGLAYCQLIRNENKQKRLEWAQRNLHENFDDVIWSDEASIQLDSADFRSATLSVPGHSFITCSTGTSCCGVLKKGGHT